MFWDGADELAISQRTHRFPRDAQTDHSGAVWHICIWRILLFRHRVKKSYASVYYSCTFASRFVFGLTPCNMHSSRTSSVNLHFGDTVSRPFFFFHFIHLLYFFIFIFALFALMCAARHLRPYRILRWQVNVITRGGELRCQQVLHLLRLHLFLLVCYITTVAFEIDQGAASALTQTRLFEYLCIFIKI